MFQQFIQSYWIGNYPFTQPTPLDSKPFSLALSSSAGIYALFCPNRLSGQIELAYIGQAESFGNRVNFSHHAVRQMIQNTACNANQIYVAFHLESSQTKRNQIEESLIRTFNPKYNVQHNVLSALLGHLNKGNRP